MPQIFALRQQDWSLLGKKAVWSSSDTSYVTFWQAFIFVGVFLILFFELNSTEYSGSDVKFYLSGSATFGTVNIQKCCYNDHSYVKTHRKRPRWSFSDQIQRFLQVLTHFLSEKKRDTHFVFNSCSHSYPKCSNLSILLIKKTFLKGSLEQDTKMLKFDDFSDRKRRFWQIFRNR